MKQLNAFELLAVLKAVDKIRTGDCYPKLIEMDLAESNGSETYLTSKGKAKLIELKDKARKIAQKFLVEAKEEPEDPIENWQVEVAESKTSLIYFRGTEIEVDEFCDQVDEKKDLAKYTSEVGELIHHDTTVISYASAGGVERKNFVTLNEVSEIECL